jgi:hypothetical protein
VDWGKMKALLSSRIGDLIASILGAASEPGWGSGAGVVRIHGGDML